MEHERIGFRIRVQNRSPTIPASRAPFVANAGTASDSPPRRYKEFHSHRTPPVPSTHGIHQTSLTLQNHNVAGCVLHDGNPQSNSVAMSCSCGDKTCYQVPRKILSRAVNPEHPG